MTPSTLPATKGVTEALRGAKTLLADLSLGRSIQNDRFPDQRIDGPLWNKIGDVVRCCEAALAALSLPASKQYCQCKSLTNPCIVCGLPKFIDRQWLKRKIEEDGDEGEIGAGFEMFPLSATNEAKADQIVTSLYRRFKDWSKKGFGPDDVTWCEVKAEIVSLIALSPTAPELAVKVKPLEWSDPGLGIVYADSIVGTYKINQDGYWWLADGSIRKADNIKAAQAAAQADFESRILPALVRPTTQNHQPQPDEMQPDKYTAGDFNGVVWGKRP